MRAIRWLDVLALVLALPVFIAGGLPLFGWGAVAAYWIAQRLVHDALFRRAAVKGDPKKATMVLAVSMMARVWLLAFVIFACGKADRDAGLAAAVLSIVLVTTYLVGLMVDTPKARLGR